MDDDQTDPECVYEGVKCVAAINAIRAAIPMRYEELADGWCVPEVKE